MNSDLHHILMYLVKVHCVVYPNQWVECIPFFIIYILDGMHLHYITIFLFITTSCKYYNQTNTFCLHCSGTQCVGVEKFLALPVVIS